MVSVMIQFSQEDKIKALLARKIKRLRLTVPITITINPTKQMCYESNSTI
jgi:hypothetical protein